MKEFKFNIDGKNYEAQVAEQGNGVLAVTLNGSTYAVEVPAMAHHAAKPVVHAAAPAAAPAGKPAGKPAAAPAAGSITAPLPGTIKQIVAAEGAKVKRGDTILTMEAMKMENAITAEADGTVVKVLVGVGASVNQGDALVTFQAEGAPAAPAQPAPAPKAEAPKATPAAAVPAASPAGKPAAGTKSVEAPLPGTIKQVLVSVGQEIAAGDTVVIMEAMKMENNITAEFAGKVTAINVAVGDQVQSGQALVETA